MTSLSDRASKLFRPRQSELREQRAARIGALNAQFAKAGMFQSGNRMAALQERYGQELRAAAAVAWEVARGAHAAFGSDLSDSTRGVLKTWIGDAIRSIRSEISEEFSKQAAVDGKVVDFNLTGAVETEFARYDAEVDNFLDTMTNQPKPASSIVINAHTIGAVVTGDNATVHVKDNAEATRKLTAALDSLRAEIAKAELSDRSKRELIEIAGDAQQELAKGEPNETKLLTFFTVLAQTVQTLPSAKPAYDSVKAILAGFGINLP